MCSIKGWKKAKNLTAQLTSLNVSNEDIQNLNLSLSIIVTIELLKINKLKDKKVTRYKVYLIFLFGGDGRKKGCYILINEWQIVANW